VVIFLLDKIKAIAIALPITPTPIRITEPSIILPDVV
jgi:hypothetical protein